MEICKMISWFQQNFGAFVWWRGSYFPMFFFLNIFIPTEHVARTCLLEALDTVNINGISQEMIDFFSPTKSSILNEYWIPFVNIQFVFFYEINWNNPMLCFRVVTITFLGNTW